MPPRWGLIEGGHRGPRTRYARHWATICRRFAADFFLVRIELPPPFGPPSRLSIRSPGGGSIAIRQAAVEESPAHFEGLRSFVAPWPGDVVRRVLPQR